MSIATSARKPWIAIVFYAIDQDFNLYFISEPTTKHSLDIVKNNKVACSIVDSSQVVTDKKIGVQLEGVASEVKEKNKLQIILSMWHETNPGFEHVISIPNILKKIIKGRFYQVKPTLIKFFNEELYGSEGFEIFTFV
jgi:uncharacterized protein YhbP (UPF0306 family)